MICIKLTERSTFDPSPEDFSVHIYDHAYGKYKGEILGETGYIQFADFEQLCEFKKMLDLIIEATKAKEEDLKKANK